MSLQVTYLFFRDRWGAETDEDDDNGSEGTEDEGEVEVVQVLQHSWSPVLLPTRRGAINKLHDHPNQTHSKPSHEAPESTLRKASTEKRSLQITSGCSCPSPFPLSQDFLCLMEIHSDAHQRRIFSGKNPHFLSLPLNMEQIEHKQCKNLLLTTLLQRDFDTSSLNGRTTSLSCFQMGLPRSATCSDFLEANPHPLDTGLRSTNACQGKAV